MNAEEKDNPELKAKAYKYYRMAAEADVAEAMTELGRRLYDGIGVNKDEAESDEWYMRGAAAYGYNMAVIKFTLMTYRGLGCPKDLRKAYGMFRKLIRSREKFFGVYRFNSVVKFYRAKILEHGEGHRKNFEEGLTWYKRAAGLERMDERESAPSVPEAMYKVADTYFMQGKFAEAVQVYEKLTESRARFNYPYNLEAAKKLKSGIMRLSKRLLGTSKLSDRLDR